MRDDAARALRVDDDLPRHAELRSVDSIDEINSLEDAYAELRARASERRFEPTRRPSAVAAVALEEPAAATVTLPRTAPGRSYGAHRRGDGYTPSRVVGAQPGRRTVEITGQVQAPRRRSQTTAAFAARPDRAALWAFWLAIFLIVMAVVTAHG